MTTPSYLLDEEPTTLEDFLAANTDRPPEEGGFSEEEIAQVKALQPNEVIAFGIGGGWMFLRRIS